MDSNNKYYGTIAVNKINDGLEKLAKSIIGNIVEGPQPDTYNPAFPEMGLYGVSRPTLDNTWRRYYGNALNNFAGNPIAQRLMDQNNLRMIQNEMQYNPAFFELYTR